MLWNHDEAMDTERHRGDFAERFERAAIQAEFDTGVREPDEHTARTHVLIRLARMGLGSLVLLIGLAMIPLPGPGWLAVAAGLAILSKDVAWADRLLRLVRRRIPGVPEDGGVPRSALLTGSVMGAAGVAVSLWWYTT
jgi:uncharacterized protein (TIGR02611 family)